MSFGPSRIEILEASLARLSARLPETPVRRVMLSRLLVDLGRGMSALLDQRIRPAGVAEVELRVLTVLFSQPQDGAHPSDLCARTGQSPANMSRISDALVKRELITRVLSATDRRRMVLRITEKGEEFVRRLLPTLFSPLEEMFADFSDADLEALTAQLKRLFAKLPTTPPPEHPERAP